uniref:TPM_phosphatase domain-containing protein n=2 Tax=Bursaphelenchus xylophilus TaxID=6326 RepID=A0A1I7RNA1_BURXY
MKPLWLLLTFLAFTWAQEWDASNYPNPTATGFRQCKMKSRAQICDPDGILSEQERYRLNHELTQLEAKTRQDYAQNFCEKKGISAAIALAKHVRGGSDAHVRAMANELRSTWTLDQQCLKSMVIVLAVDDRKFWVARDDRIPVYANEFTQIFNLQKPLFQQKKYQQALINVLHETWTRTSEKQGQLPAAPGGTSDGGRKGPIGGGGFPMKIPSIPTWVILAIVFVVVPTLICCCICYCCCCKNKGEREAVPDAEGGGQQQGGGGGSGMRTFFQSMAGSYVMQMIMNCIRNQGQRRSAAPGGGGYPGGYQPGVPQPQAKEGQGLYPNQAVKDEGGGGSW